MGEKLVLAKWIVPSAYEKPIRDGGILIKDGFILDIGLGEELKVKYPNANKEVFKSGIIIPGLVNGHTHIPMSILRGIAEDLSLMTWLHQYIFPVEAKLKRDWVYWGSLLSIIEMIRSGITLFCDMYLFEEEVIKAVEEAGVKALVGEGLFDFPSPSYGPLEKGFELTESLLKNFQNHSLIKIAVCPHTLYTCSSETVKRCIKLTEKYGVKLHIHLSENQEEIKVVKERYGKTPIELLYDIGGVNENLIAVHGVKITPKEIELMAQAKASFVHCPESNLKLGSGIAPIPEVIKAGINLALGTDGPASNNDLDMFSEMRTASLIQKGVKEDPTVITAKDIFYAATEGGAKALGFSDTGKLAIGYKADLAVIDLSNHSLQPDYNPFALIVYTAKAGCVSHLMVDGRWIMKDYKILHIDEDMVIEQIDRIKTEVWEIIT
ncbi:amidohydrolase [Thermodesulfobacterium sp. TA1]|uniref:amidohydrolase family protein n=1 Tax=Thermodesulfobacterium sp. TA1 TaxID=2234087 RepID=UPI0012329180|nr:amidohydrolase [Thermodesulfobacterium sp. TA1]QER42296.1 amidohydrolase [Thermodesulfobacterium sp. TA1]